MSRETVFFSENKRRADAKTDPIVPPKFECKSAPWMFAWVFRQSITVTVNHGITATFAWE